MKISRATPVLFVYKSDELTYEEPGGNLVTFARFA
jgi:hypothetical protein